MPGIRIILIALFVWIAWIFIKSMLNKPVTKKKDGTEAADVSSDTVVKCDVCGLHVPANEALSSNGKYYCSESHKRQAG